MNKTEQAVQLFNKYAVDYAKKFSDQSLYADAYKSFFDLIPTNGNVIELACGPGNITRHILDKRPDLQFYCTDLSENMLEIAEKANPEASFGKLNMNDLDKVDDNYNAILIGFGLPYLNQLEVKKLIRISTKILKENGCTTTLKAHHIDKAATGYNLGTNDPSQMDVFNVSYAELASSILAFACDRLCAVGFAGSDCPDRFHIGNSAALQLGSIRPQIL